MRDAQVSLYVWGKVLTGWTSVEIVDSLEALSPTFALGYSDRTLEVDGSIRISPGDECSVRIGDEPVITGYVDDSELEESAATRSLSVSGRSRTCDLVDCSALHKPAEWRDATIDTSPRTLSSRSGCGVLVQAPVGAPLKLALPAVEARRERLRRHFACCRHSALMLHVDRRRVTCRSSLSARGAPAALKRGRQLSCQPARSLV